MADLKVTQVRSGIGTKPKHRGTLRALGLGRIGKSNVLPDRPEIRGMIAKVPHLVDVEEVAGVGDDNDARKSQFRIDAARQAKGGNNSRGAHERRQQIDGAAVGPAKPHHVHGWTLTLACFSIPYPPVRMMVSPSWTPAAISVRSLVARPSFTGSAVAVSP